MPKKLRIPTTREEAEINRGIAADSDTFVPSDADWARAKPMAETDPALVEAHRSSARPGSAKQYHVIPHGEGWAVKKVGLRTTALFDNKTDAVERARGLARASGTEWVEYRRDGTVRDIHRAQDRDLAVRQAQH